MSQKPMLTSSLGMNFSSVLLAAYTGTHEQSDGCNECPATSRSE